MKAVDVALVLSKARTMIDSIHHWDGEDEAERVALINEIDDAIDVLEPTPPDESEPKWEPALLNPDTELDKAMANLRAALKFDNDAREVPENGAGIKRDAHQWLREAADEAIEAHEALRLSQSAAEAMTGG